MMTAPMTQGLPQPTSLRNARVVRMEPDVKSAKTRELFNVGVSGKSGMEKSADPTCYDALVQWRASWQTQKAVRHPRSRNMTNYLAQLRRLYSKRGSLGAPLGSIANSSLAE